MSHKFEACPGSARRAKYWINLVPVLSGFCFFASGAQSIAQDCGNIDGDTSISSAVNGACFIVSPSVLTFDENGSVKNVDDLNQVTSANGVRVRQTDLQFSIINRGTIEGYASIYIDDATGGEFIRNFGVIRSTISENNFGTAGIVFTNQTVFSTLVNEESGVINGDTSAISLVSGPYVNEIYNFGSISGTTNARFGDALGIDIGFNGSAGRVVNFGTVQGLRRETQGGDFVDININPFGNGGLQLFENLQRGVDLYSGQDRLFLAGELPLAYNIIIMSNESYGQLNVDLNGSGNTTTTFGISALGDRFSATSFEAVMTGVAAENFNNTTGTYLGADWALSEQTERTNVWDLTFQSTPLFGTQQSLQNLRDDTVSVMLHAGLAARSALDFECSRFGYQDLCLRMGGRIRSSSNDNSVVATFASLAGAYRIDDTFRVGGYLDQQVAASSPNGFDYQASFPTLGAFLEYGQEDGSGVQLRLAASRGAGQLSMARGLSLTDTEIGKGQAEITASGVLGRIGYGVNLETGTVLTPYFGFQRVSVKRDAYQEAVQNDGQFPFAYDAYEMTEIATVLGVTIDADLQQRLSFRGDFGLEIGGSQDFSTFSGSSSMSEFREFSLEVNNAANDTRFFVGASLNFVINQATDFELGSMVREAAYGNDIDVSTGASFIFRF